MKAKTRNKLKFKAKAVQRAKSSYDGALRILKLLEKVEHTDKVSSVVASQAGLDIIENKYSNF